MNKPLLALLAISLFLAGCSTPTDTNSPPPDASNDSPVNLTAGTTVIARFPVLYNSINERVFDSNPIISELRLFPFDWSPYGFMACDGARLSIFEHEALYSIIDSKFGGDGGKTVFSLPNFKDKSPLPDLTYNMSIEGNYPNTDDPSTGPNGEICYYGITNEEYFEGLFLSEIILAINPNQNMLPCDGRLLKINQNQALFSLISNQFGGDGLTTFALPDLSSTKTRVTGASYYIVVYGLYPRRKF